LDYNDVVNRNETHNKENRWLKAAVTAASTTDPEVWAEFQSICDQNALIESRALIKIIDAWGSHVGELGGYVISDAKTPSDVWGGFRRSCATFGWLSGFALTKILDAWCEHFKGVDFAAGVDAVKTVRHG
jgi:hypothetical protein